MHISRPLCAFAALLLVVAACKHDKSVAPPVTTTLSCQTAGGQTQACTIPLTGASSFTIALAGRDCDAHDNVVRVISPVDSILTKDACYLQGSPTWVFPGPFSGTASLNLSVLSKGFDYPPALRLSGTAPTWTLRFEDGGDQDFNDIVLTVTTSP